MSDQEYTTAVIVALPAGDDPIHEHVAEDAHVTLHFLGEAQALDPETIEGIKADLALLATNLHPFPAKLSGTAVLGDDQANVCLVESDALSKIHELLGASTHVSTAKAGTEQYPNWIPHLTLAYPDEDGMGSPVVDKPVDSFTVGGLGLWLGGEQTNFPLAKAAPQVAGAPVTAAGPDFEESLHPRGADGRFIEKFGIVKFLTGGSWSYGKVTGIHKNAAGEVRVTVTPSDLAGHTHGQPVELGPQQVYRAPKTKAHLATTDVGVKKIGGQGGSNPGGLYEIPNGSKVHSASLGTEVTIPGEGVSQFYVKKPKSKSHGQNEALANLLYEEAGVPVPEVDLHADGQLYSKIIKGQQDMQAQLSNPEWTDQVRRNFAVDAWLGNRDVFGMTYDNVLTDENGVPWRIDNGGALLYRAMGEKKTDFGSKVTELDAFRTGKKAKIFGPGMTKAQELDGAERVLAISPQHIEELVAAHGLPKSLADTLKARRAYLADYYGLPLPESKTAPGAQEGSPAPLVDAPDIAASKGKPRSWFKVKLHQAALLAQVGDKVEIPGLGEVTYGVDGAANTPLSTVGAQAQMLGWQQQHGADAEVMFKKTSLSTFPRPEHGSKLMAADLSAQNWQRGDKIVSKTGTDYKILGVNMTNGAVLVRHGDNSPLLLDTFGPNSAEVWEIQRWDPPAVETPIEQTEDELASFTLSPETGKYEAAVPAQEDAQAAVDTPAPPVAVLPKQKTGQAAAAETQIKADLDQPLPTGSGAPAPKKTAAKSGEKKMLIGDGTEAIPGSQLVSKKDGKTYEFVKPKGQYAVVTDPNADDPDKLLLKLASTMTQPGKLPAGEVEIPTTATGEVPALGMMAAAKDGHSGKITMISPDGKFVFITDATGKKKRKSTGTVSILSAPPAVADTPQTATPAPGPIKAYGEKPHWTDWKGEEKKSAFLPVEELSAKDMVLVGYSDGSVGLEPYSGQPLDSIGQNVQNKVAVYGQASGYLGPISSAQLITAAQADNKDHVYQVVYSGNVFFTDGTTGPSGGLVLWYADDHDSTKPGDDAFETHAGTPITLTVIATAAADFPMALPEGTSFQTADEYGDSHLPANPPLYGEEAKTLAQWKGQISEGMEISLDGQNWMSVKSANPGGSVTVETGNGDEVFLNGWSSATYVIKAPALKDGDAKPATVAPDPLAALDDILGPATPKKKAAELEHGDVVKLHDGSVVIVAATAEEGPGELSISLYGHPEAESAPKDAELPHLGNIKNEPVTVSLGMVSGSLYPGATIDAAEGTQLKVVTYPTLKDDGDVMAVIVNGDAAHPQLIKIGGEGADFGANVALPVHLGALQGPEVTGIDPQQVNALFDAAIQPPAKPAKDHTWGMTQQGLEYGKAQYPIYYGEASDTYFRQGPAGMQEWTEDTGTWHTVFGSAVEQEKVWDGAPFEGTLQLPASAAAEVEFNPGGKDYKPKPGEAVASVNVKVGAHWEHVLVAFPTGDTENGPVHVVLSSDQVAQAPSPATVLEKMKAGESGYADFTVIHDPYSGTSPAAPEVTHHEGPELPQAIQDRVDATGYEPQPGAQFYVLTTPGGAHSILVRDPDGSYRRILSNGQLASKKWSLKELTDYLIEGSGEAGEVPAGTTAYTFTYLPAGEDAPKTIVGLPSGYQPFVPAEGQTVLKVTLANGKTSAYLQQYPGSGWYLLEHDGTISETSGAVKSNAVVQNILAQGGTSGTGAKYEVLGVEKDTAAELPTFSNSSGSFTPGPGQQVIKMTSYDGDPDPWFYAQQPDGAWAGVDETNGGWSSVLSDETMQHALTDSAAKGPEAAKYALVYDGGGAAAVDTAAIPSFDGYTPTDGVQVIAYHSGNSTGGYYVQLTPGTNWIQVGKNGKPDFNYVLGPTDVPDNKGPEFGNDFQQVWPLPDTSAPAPAGTPTFSGYIPKPGDKIVEESDGSGGLYVQHMPDGMFYKIEPDGTEGIVAFGPKAGQSGIDGGDLTVVHDPAAAAAPAGPPTFGGYTPTDGDKVIQFTAPGGNVIFLVAQNGSPTYKPITTDGTVNPVGGVTQSQLDNGMEGIEQVWPPAGDTVDTAPDATPSFGGYTPQPGEKIAEFTTGGSLSSHYVQKPGQTDWQVVMTGGSAGKLGSKVPDQSIQNSIKQGNTKIVWGGAGDTPAAPVVVDGYQATAGQAVIHVSGPSGAYHMVQLPDGNWQKVHSGVLTGEPFGQDTVDFLTGLDTVTVTEVQGSLKAEPPAVGVSSLTEGKYAGVQETTTLSAGSYTVAGGAQLTASQQEKLNGLVLNPGESAYTAGNSMVFYRDSTAQWSFVYAGGEKDPFVSWSNDAVVEQWAAEKGYTLNKVTFTAPSAAPAAPKKAALASFSGWAELDIPNPESFGLITDASQAHGAKAGDWVFLASKEGPGSGVFCQLHEDWMAGDVYLVGKMQAYKDGQPAGAMIPLAKAVPWNFGTDNSTAFGFYLSGKGSGIPAPAAPAPTPTASQAPTPSAPATPSYPGALMPSQEDINAWGGDLTKDGHIPTSGMFVTGKGPMSGKIISVSKDKTKATVLASDGKKTTRLISALKTDKSANYQAYAAPASVKDIPAGMPLAVDTVAEALSKTAKDGKFRAVLNGHPGVSGGQMVVTKTTGPSGKAYNRVHMTLTPAQREALVAMLSGTGEKGDWVATSKMSDAVAVGDQLPMRQSSQDNPDGTPRWKVDTSVKPPTHKVTKVEVQTDGVRLVTLENSATGEVITSRFHPGKTLNYYTWDPDKPKVVMGNALTLSENAKAQGWALVNDGGISAIHGGADNGTLHNEPGTAVTKSAFQDAGYSWTTLRNVSADGVVIELVDPKGPNKNSTTGTTVISVPEGVDEKALGAALAKLGVDYRPMTQEDAKTAVRGTLRTLLNLDINDVDTAKGWSDEKLFAQAGQTMGIADLGWTDVLVGVDETTGKTSFFWSDRARNAIAAKTSYNLVYRAAATGNANAIVSTVKYGSANSVLKRTTGMIDPTSGTGTGASWSSDQVNHAGHGSYSSASSVTHLPSSNPMAHYKPAQMMVYSRPEAVLGRIADFRVANNDAFGMGQGSGSDHLKHAVGMPKVRDFFIGGGLPTEAVGFIAVASASERLKAIEKLKKDGFATINGRPIEEIIILQSDAVKLKASDLPPVSLPANARPILDLPATYDAPTGGDAATTGEVAA